MSPATPNQLAAITATGNVLVEAGAGAGKTRTLVERCLARLLDPADPVSLDEMLLVTFTEAAAAEMRRRIRESLEQRVDEERRRPAMGDEEKALQQRLEEQLALLDAAHISTLHGFCLQLVRDHFYDLAIDPQINVLDEAQARMLASDTLDKLMQAHYAGKSPANEAVQELILVQGRGWDRPIRDLVLKVHEYGQTLADPEGWFQAQLRMFKSTDASQWQAWLLDSMAGWRAEWVEALAAEAAGNPNARQCLAAFQALPEQPSRAQATAMLAEILAANGNWPAGRKTALSKPLKKLFDEADFLESLAVTADGKDPLAEDWGWVRLHMIALLELAQEFGAAFAQAKRELGAVDFHDLEQFALQLLWDRTTDRPTVIAQHWRAKLRLVFVDEYQDINAAQDKIIETLSREGEAANRFLVGDVKQSIYRFRLADPHIFQHYTVSWKTAGQPGRVIPLAENFRSHEAILQFVNPLFSALMRKAVGGVAYDDDARLRFGDPEGRAAMTVAEEVSGEPRVELHLRLTHKDDAPHDDPGMDGGGLADLSRTEQEARLVAGRLARLKADGFQVWDRAAQARRPIDWRDIVVLLRSPRNKAETFAKEFDRQGVPLEVERGGFYATTEISDLLNLLRLLDNPLQDVPTLAVLRSPLVGLTLDELATIRLAAPRGRFWTALCRWHDRESARSQSQVPVAREEAEDEEQLFLPIVSHSAFRAPQFERVGLFLRRFGRWRQLARQGSLSRCLETVLDETHYEDWLLAQRRGAQRRANVERLLAMTRQFDQLQRQGLFRFLRFVEAEQEAEVDPEPAAVETGNAVRLISIHRSKGLEFPVVVLADLGGRFNLADTHGAIILDEEYGLCPQIRPPVTQQRYPSLPYWLAARRQKRELLGEELRLLYVAMTRACDKLILTGTASRTTAEAKWRGNTETTLTRAQVLAANSYVDWLGPLMATLAGTPDWMNQTDGRSPLLGWRLVELDDLSAPVWSSGFSRQDAEPPEGGTPNRPRPLLGRGGRELEQLTDVPDAAAWDALEDRLGWQYPHLETTLEPAKTSVTTLRRRWLEEAESEAKPFFSFLWGRTPKPPKAGLSAAEIGTAHHRFLQFVALDQAGSVDGLVRAAGQLVAAKVLTEAEASSLDYPALAAFWTSDIGRRICGQPERVHRELPFTARFSPRELQRPGVASAGDASFGVPPSGGVESCRLNPELQTAPGGEFVVVQGVADLAVILPEAIWLVDFKTDHFAAKELTAKVEEYEPQLRLYALALERIYRCPATERWLHFLTLSRSVRIGEVNKAEPA